MTSTKIVKTGATNPDQSYIMEAASILKDGGLVIIPTETVYGIAANMLNKKTLSRLYEIKQRPKDKPFSVHIEEKLKIEEFARSIPISAYKLMDKFWPGPLTLVLKSKGSGKVGLRMPDNEIALRVITQSGVPVICPSANLSGKQAPGNFREAIKDLNGLVDFAIDAGDTKLGIESSVADLTVEPLCIQREGAIKKEDIESAIKKKFILFICTGNSCRSVMAKALLEKKMKGKGRFDVEVLSAGLMATGLSATEATREVLKREGMDVSGHLSQIVTNEMIKKSDIILVMEKLHEQRILQLVPDAKNRVFLLKEFAKINDTGFDISDPIGKPKEFYEQTYSVIKEAIERISNII